MLTPDSATAADTDGTTPLHLAAASKGWMRLCEALLAIPGVMVNAQRLPDGATPLMYAAAHGSDAACQLLLNRGANPLAEYTGSRGIALHAAAQGGHAAVCAVLLQHDPGSAAAVTVDGASSLHVAASHGRAACIRTLLSLSPPGAPASADLRNNSTGGTPLMYAARGKHPEACAVLIELGAAVAATDSLGVTALHEAAGAGSVDVCALLLQHGASAHSENQERARPLLYAVAGGSAAVCELLVSQGRADLSAQDGQGITALELAHKLGGHTAECAAVLEEAARKTAAAASV
jgi:ankyrin repeat protein